MVSYYECQFWTPSCPADEGKCVLKREQISPQHWRTLNLMNVCSCFTSALAFFPFFAVSISRALSHAGFLGYQRIMWPGRTMPLPRWFKMMMSMESYFFFLLKYYSGSEAFSERCVGVVWGWVGGANGKWCNGLHKLPEVIGDTHRVEGQICGPSALLSPNLLSHQQLQLTAQE